MSPANLVTTERDEKLWAKAKSLAHKQYPDVSKDSSRFWKIVTTIYQRLKGGSKEKKGSIV